VIFFLLSFEPLLSECRQDPDLMAIDKAREEKKELVTPEDVYKQIVEASETTRKLQEYAMLLRQGFMDCLVSLEKRQAAKEL